VRHPRDSGPTCPAVARRSSAISHGTAGPARRAGSVGVDGLAPHATIRAV